VYSAYNDRKLTACSPCFSCEHFMLRIVLYLALSLFLLYPFLIFPLHVSAKYTSFLLIFLFFPSTLSAAFSFSSSFCLSVLLFVGFPPRYLFIIPNAFFPLSAYIFSLYIFSLFLSVCLCISFFFSKYYYFFLCLSITLFSSLLSGHGAGHGNG